MTAVDVYFRYGRTPTTAEMRALDRVREVYGIRRIKINEKDQTLRVEFDASRLKEDTVAALLRRAGLDVKEKLTLA
jgi:hypothetical protein